MKPAILAVVGGLLIVSLGLKVVFESGTIVEDTGQEAYRTLRTVMEQQGFTSMPTPESRVAGGFKGSCVLWVSLMDHQGQEAVFAQRYANTGRLAYVFKGVMHDDAPLFEASTDRYLTRLRLLFDSSVAAEPIYQIAHSPLCARDEIQQLMTSMRQAMLSEGAKS